MSEEIESLKRQRRVALKKFEDLDILKNERISEYIFSKFKSEKDILFTELQAMPNNKDLVLPVVFGGAIVTKKEISLPNEMLIFITKWTPGSTLGWHYHSDCIEEIEVQEGRVKIFLEKEEPIILNKNEKIKIATNIKHQTTALEKSEIKMIFKKTW